MTKDKSCVKKMFVVIMIFIAIYVTFHSFVCTSDSSEDGTNTDSIIFLFVVAPFSLHWNKIETKKEAHIHSTRTMSPQCHGVLNLQRKTKTVVLEKSRVMLVRYDGKASWIFLTSGQRASEQERASASNRKSSLSGRWSWTRTQTKAAIMHNMMKGKTEVWS